MKNKRKNMKEMKNVNEIDEIRDFLYQNKLKATKLNHCIDTKIQRFT